MISSKKILGDNAEDCACDFLLSNNFNILTRNYRYKHYEIDIIAQKDECIYFCEVKIRKNNDYGYPESFVSKQQQKRIKLAAEKFIFAHNWDGKIKFNIIAIESKNMMLTFFEDAFF